MGALSALIDFSNPLNPDGPRLRQAFGVARQLLVAHEPLQVRAVLDAVQEAAQQGAWCVGYLRYEAAPAFDAALAVHPADGPLAWFAVYDEALPWPGDAANAADAAEVQVQWQEACQRPAFDAALASIQRAIAEGELYQVNFTAPLLGTWRGEPGVDAARALFSALQRAQPGGYAALLDTGDAQVLSVSPELFFDWQAGRILTRPMKGTARRGASPHDDAAQAEALRTSAKERAENVMIVDLLRNDLSRIAQPFSVRVPRLFHTEALPTLWQMTSDVEARTRDGCSLADVFAALFPCGSVTGAPKVRAMQMIHALEPQARGVYCGAVGVVQPGEDGIRATFNVPIRTVTLCGGALRCGIGSGITADASAEGEWQEWRHKQAFVRRASAPFALLETLGLQDGCLRDADAHLARMAQAARHFSYPWDVLQVEQSLQALVQAHAQGAWRVRLLLDAQGRAQAEAHALEAGPTRVRLCLAEHAIAEAHGEFVRFKTTRRAHYDEFTPAQPGVFDTLLWNADGEITECTRGNVALLLDGRWVTPPLRCGLLGGVARAKALRQGRVAEAVVRLADLPRVQALAFVNSLRGWIPAELAPRTA
ncbi:MAG: aminodeoxychorismate synthase component I [Polaromonas sp.]|uniref:aminodeoxychorismate synthase component I n=1 Tax=Polaromonas sp. TaxID=1869339 RepID=UPI0027361892|nr:aminodeoxychorismate synthase component I [Polaromonas sp.]MDP3796367.1 aminodeoxychorismate synthase component I [Polaromonas sp.]